MSDTWLTIGYAVAAGLCLIPVLMVARLVYGIISGVRADRRREASKVVRELPRYGAFTNYGGPLWFGDVGDISVALDVPEWPPADSTIARLASTLAGLNGHAARARAFIERQEDGPVWADGAAVEPCGLELAAGSTWTLEVGCPSDSGHVYRIEFAGDVPTSYGLDG